MNEHSTQADPSPATASNLWVTGRTALVTGAGNGLGRAIALHLSRAGADVVLAGRDADKLAAVSRELPGASRVETVDVSSAASVDSLAGRLTDDDVSILVNNAGVAGPVLPLWEVSPAEWDEVFSVNVRGTYLMCRALLPGMIRRGNADIINVASVSGKRPLARRTPYTASKMAVIGLTVTLAHEVGAMGVRVNTVSPGPVAGPRMARNFAREAERTGTTPEAAEREFVSRSAMQRMVTEDEVGTSVVAILSMTGLTGADIDLSAGMIGR